MKYLLVVSLIILTFTYSGCKKRGAYMMHSYGCESPPGILSQAEFESLGIEMTRKNFNWYYFGNEEHPEYISAMLNQTEDLIPQNGSYSKNVRLWFTIRSWYPAKMETTGYSPPFDKDAKNPRHYCPPKSFREWKEDVGTFMDSVGARGWLGRIDVWQIENELDSTQCWWRGTIGEFLQMHRIAVDTIRSCDTIGECKIAMWGIAGGNYKKEFNWACIESLAPVGGHPEIDIIDIHNHRPIGNYFNSPNYGGRDSIDFNNFLQVRVLNAIKRNVLLTMSETTVGHHKQWFNLFADTFFTLRKLGASYVYLDGLYSEMVDALKDENNPIIHRNRGVNSDFEIWKARDMRIRLTAIKQNGLYAGGQWGVKVNPKEWYYAKYPQGRDSAQVVSDWRIFKILQRTWIQHPIYQDTIRRCASVMWEMAE